MTELERVKAERDCLINEFLLDECPIDMGYECPSWCGLTEEGGNMSCDYGVEKCWRMWVSEFVQQKRCD